MKKNTRNYRQNHGVSGVIYILENPGLRQGVYKIGCTRRSGSIRATELNIDANTGTPGSFSCVFEYRTIDCGKAEELIFLELTGRSVGKWGQEFFEISLDKAKELITRVCKVINEKKAVEVVNQSQPQSDNATEILCKNASIAKYPVNDSSKGRKQIYWIFGCLFIFAYVAMTLASKSDNIPYTATNPTESVSNENSLNSSDGKGFTPIPDANEAFNAFNAPPGKPRHTYIDGVDQIVMNVSLDEQKYDLPEEATRDHEISSLSQDEQSSINSVCAHDKYSNGPVAYNKCLSRQLSSLDGELKHPDISGLSQDEQSSINSVCAHDKYSNGPVAYNKCLSQQVTSLQIEKNH